MMQQVVLLNFSQKLIPDIQMMYGVMGHIIQKVAKDETREKGINHPQRKDPLKETKE
jgi:hypothetical protein